VLLLGLSPRLAVPSLRAGFRRPRKVRGKPPSVLVAGLLCALLLLSLPAFSQDPPNLENGYKSYGSYDGTNLDTVNLLNGNLTVHIPLPFYYPQRGGRLDWR
jgi:hypothetical protein